VFLGANLVSCSSAEVEYNAVTNGVAEVSWLHQLLQELHSPLQRATLVYCDNISAVYLCTNPVQHQRMKHVEIDQRVAAGDVRVLSVPTTQQFADNLTKELSSSVFADFRSSLNICTG
jgi:glucan phosphorylase